MTFRLFCSERRRAKDAKVVKRFHNKNKPRLRFFQRVFAPRFPPLGPQMASMTLPNASARATTALG